MDTQAQPTFPTRVDIPADRREALVTLLNARLADAFDLYTQLEPAHWNVKGREFFQLHQLYDDSRRDNPRGGQHDRRAGDRTRRPRAGNSPARGSLVSLRHSRLHTVTDLETVAVMADRMGTFAASVRARDRRGGRASETRTPPISSRRSARATDKHLWFVEAHLQA